MPRHRAAVARAGHMAQMDFGGAGHASGREDYRAGGDGGMSLATWTGGLVSLALLTGMGLWGYQLLMRDVTGVPVVAAMEGPARVAPDDPGGRTTDYQGLAVNAIAADGPATAPPDAVTLAPAPTGLTDEDTAPGLAEAGLSVPVEGDDSVSPTGTDAPSLLDDADILALAQSLSVTPVDAPAPAAGAEVPRRDAAGIVRSPRPPVRPAVERLFPASASATPAPVEDLDPAAIPVGTRLVQLGAHDSVAAARAEWDRLDARFGDYLSGKRRVVQHATSGGRDFLRLRAEGFSDLADARRFCAALLARGADCIPVEMR